MKYRKKPIIIEAENWNGSYESYTRIKEIFPELEDTGFGSFWNGNYYEIMNWSIRTLEGFHNVSKGDFIIKGIKGEFYPCKPDIFEKSYELVEEQ